MTDILISKATVEDSAQILALQKAAYQSEAELYGDRTIPPLTQTLPHIADEFSTKVFLKALHGGRIIGSVKASLDDSTCLIGRLIVHPDYQRQGIGTSLMGKIETLFSNAERFELFTSGKGIDNIHFYQMLGYRVFREENLSPAVQLVFMEKRQ